MQTSVTFKNLDSSEHLKAYVRDKLTRLDKYLHNPAEANVVLSVEKHRHIAEVNILGDRLSINGTEETTDMYSAIDMVMDKIEAQIKKGKQKVRERRGESPKEMLADAALAEDRLVGLLAMLVDFACSLDPLVWRTWGKVAPRSKVQSLGSLRHVLHRFATGDERVSESEAEEEVLKLRHMLASMVVALGQAGRISATDVVSGVLAPLAPSKIEDLVRFEKGGFFVAKEVKCWNKYKELAEKHNEVNIEAAIREKIQHFVEELMRRRSTRRE